MANPKGNEASLRESRFKAAWRSGSTRTIRVPVVLAEVTLEYAHQLDKGIEQRDTSGSTDKVQQLKDEIERLQNDLGNLRAENEKFSRQLEEVRSQIATPLPEIELPDAADLLNKLKAKRKRSTTTLVDVEKILEILEGDSND